MQEKLKKIHYGRGHVHPKEVIALAIRLLEEGNSFRATGRIVGVPHQTVTYWLKKHVAMLPDLEQINENNPVELDELCTFVKKK